MFLQKVSKNRWFLNVTFQNAGNLHIKKDLRDARPATRPDPGVCTMITPLTPPFPPPSV